jgi:hypothetical protein
MDKWACRVRHAFLSLRKINFRFALYSLYLLRITKSIHTIRFLTIKGINTGILEKLKLVFLSCLLNYLWKFFLIQIIYINQ